MKTLGIILAVFFCVAFTPRAQAQAQQTSDPFNFPRFINQGDFLRANGITGDLMFITKYTNSVADYAIITFGDTFKNSSTQYFNMSAWSGDFDLSDGMSFQFRGNGGVGGQGMTPLSLVPGHDPNAPDASENQIWFSRSFVLGQSIYTYYNSFGTNPNPPYNNHYLLGTGLAVIRGIPDITQMPEFTRIPSAWHQAVSLGTCQGGSSPGTLCLLDSQCAGGGTCNVGRISWQDGHPVVQTDPTDGNTYLYLFNPYGIYRVLFTESAVENNNAYQVLIYVGPNDTQWVTPAPFQNVVPMWTDDSSLRTSVEYNQALHQWVAMYFVYPSDGNGVDDSPLAYRTAPALTGPWSDRHIIFWGTRSSGYLGAHPPPDCYSAVYRPFYDNGQTSTVLFSCGGSHGYIDRLEYTFNHTVTTRNVGPIDKFLPQGLPEALNITLPSHTGSASVYYFRDTYKYGTYGSQYANSYLYSTSDLDASDNLSFDKKLRFNALRPIKSRESRAFLTAVGYPMRSNVGAFYKAFDRNGADMGTGFAYTRPASFAHFRRVDGMLPPGELISKVYDVVDPSSTSVVINDENDPSGNVYLARLARGTQTTITDLGAAATIAGNYDYSTLSTITVRNVPREVRTWSQNVSAAVPLFDNAVKPAIFHNDYSNYWLAVYTVKNPSVPGTSEIAMRTAPTVAGTWSAPVKIYSLPNNTPAGNRLYNVKHLDEFDRDGGKLVYFYASDAESSTVNLFELKLHD